MLCAVLGATPRSACPNFETWLVPVLGLGGRERLSGSTLEAFPRGWKRHGSDSLLYMSWVLVVEEGDRSRRLTLPSTPLEVGSGVEVEMRLEHPTVSRRHARLEPREGGVWLSDLGSSNGTRVAGKLLTEGTLWSPGESLELGSLRCHLEAADSRDLEPALVLSKESSSAVSPSSVAPDGAGGEGPVPTLNVGSLRDFLLGSVPQLVSALEEARSSSPTRTLTAETSDDSHGNASVFSASALAVIQAAGRAVLEGFPCRSLEILQHHEGSSDDVVSLLFRGGEASESTSSGGDVRAKVGRLEMRGSFLPGFHGSSVAPVMELALRLAALASPRSAADSRAKANILDRSSTKAKPLKSGFAEPALPQPATVDPVLRRLYEQARRIARGDVGVLILGESGTGKEVLARFVHQASLRRGQPWVALNCAALPEDLLEAELFGIERGVATGVEARPGKFELANGGTLFLDEIGDMAPAIQAKILRVLQEKEVYRLGGRDPRQAHVRVLAATNQDLQRKIEQGGFRLDLYHRIADCLLRLPPLRERRVDLPNLAAHFFVRRASDAGVDAKGISKAALESLLRYPWPGNIRQLEREMARAALFLEDGELLQTRHLQEEIRRGAEGVGRSDKGSLKERMESVERGLILETLVRHDGQVRPAAADLGVSRTTLYRRLQELEIQP